MGNPTTVHKQKAFLSPIDKELFNNKHKSASDHYGKYLDKILEVKVTLCHLQKSVPQRFSTGGKVIYDYEEFNKRE